MHYLTAPVVAKVIRLQPTQWTVAPSLAFTLIGQRYASFNRECLASAGILIIIIIFIITIIVMHFIYNASVPVLKKLV